MKQLTLANLVGSLIDEYGFDASEIARTALTHQVTTPPTGFIGTEFNEHEQKLLKRAQDEDILNEDEGPDAEYPSCGSDTQYAPKRRTTDTYTYEWRTLDDGRKMLTELRDGRFGGQLCSSLVDRVTKGLYTFKGFALVKDVAKVTGINQVSICMVVRYLIDTKQVSRNGRKICHQF